MAYTPINDEIYIAAFSGALAGMGASGKLVSSTNASDYAATAAMAGAYAQQFDTLWNNASDANTFQLRAVEELTASSWQERSPTPSTTTVTPTFYSPLCQSLIAMITGASSYLTGQGITPPTPGGGIEVQWNGNSLGTKTAINILGLDTGNDGALFAGDGAAGVADIQAFTEGYASARVLQFGGVTPTINVDMNGLPSYLATVFNTGGATTVNLPTNAEADAGQGPASIIIKDTNTGGGRVAQDIIIQPQADQQINGYFGLGVSKTFVATAGQLIWIQYQRTGVWNIILPTGAL